MQDARPTIRLIGLPTDSHSSFLRGPARAPAAIRAALASEHANNACESGLEIGSDIAVEYVGDLPLTEGAGDFDLVRVAAGETGGRTPIFLGGDHMVSYPIVAGLASVHGPLNILHFDAHPDLYDDFGGDPLSHASPFARIMEQGLANRLVQVGIRTMNRHCREQVQRFGVEVIEMRNIQGDLRVPLSAPVYVSIDVDALDPAFVPGVSHCEPGGLSVRQLLSLLHGIEEPIVAADVVELNPRNDATGLSAMVAAKVVRELIGVMLR